MQTKITFALMMLFPCFFIFAQVEDQDTARGRDPQAREKIRAAHAAYITQRLELTTSEAEKFWPVYREYAEKRRELRLPLREARRKNADDKTLLDLDLKIKQQELDLEKEYTQKLQKLISAEKMIKLREAEIDFRKLILRQIERRRRK
jgi:hypothetical protein